MPEKIPTLEDGNDEESLAEIGDYRIEVSLEAARESIEEQFPDFKIESIAPFDQAEGGFNNAVFLVNGEYTFRFARHQKADRTLEKEVLALPAIEEEVSLSIPHFQYIGKQKETNLRFVGYRVIEGDALRPEMIKDAAGKLRVKFPERIGQFFNELHSFDVERAKQLGIPEVPTEKLYQVQLHMAQEKLFPELDKRLPDNAEALKAWIENMFREYLEDPENFTYAPSVIHGDLDFWHVRYNEEEDDVSGIIDFGSLKISDPDYDLWRPYNHYGKEFIDKLLETYSRQNPETLFKKLNFFWDAQVVRRAVRAITLGDEEVIPLNLERLQERYNSRAGE